MQVNNSDLKRQYRSVIKSLRRDGWEFARGAKIVDVGITKERVLTPDGEVPQVV